MSIGAALRILVPLALHTAGRATVVFGGDVVPHTPLLAAFVAHGGDALFAPIAPVLRAADLAFVNLETPAAPSRPQSPNVVRFNVHADFVESLLHSGIDGVSIANNHSFDAGISGVGETVTTLRAAGLRAIGGALAGEDPLAPQVFPLAGRTLCVFAATRILNFDMTMPDATQPRIGLARREPAAEERALVDAVRANRPRCGAIIVSLHSGVEYEERPEPVDRVYFHALADAGADAIVAHHSHTVQPIESYAASGDRHVPIFYSLGNFLSNQGYAADADVASPSDGHLGIAVDPRLREGLLAVLRFVAGEHEALDLEFAGFVPLWTVNTYTHVSANVVPSIATALMPRDGGGDAMLRQRWRALVRRVGPQFLAEPESLPGSAAAYRTSDSAVLANRRGH